jgi:DNA modification methylase
MGMTKKRPRVPRQESGQHGPLETDHPLIKRIEHLSPHDLKPNPRNARKHPRRQIEVLKNAVREFGIVSPIVVDGNRQIVAGHARIEAAKELGLDIVPTICVSHLTSAQVRAYVIADNHIAELAEWDRDTLAAEFAFLNKINFSVELTGFEAPEIDFMIDECLDQAPDEAPGPIEASWFDEPPVSGVGDLWQLGEHSLLCGDATVSQNYKTLLGRSKAQMASADLPYNLRINKNVGGSGSIKHREFVQASGEMSNLEFSAFLEAAVTNLCAFSRDGSVHFLFMDWRHLTQLAQICEQHYAEYLNLCVWTKTNGGMGSLYRSQHELVLVYRNGAKQHINNVKLGKFKRNRTNVWRYEGVNTINPERRRDLMLHPTVKPVELIADAIRDCSHRSGLILDPFAGSGTTIIAAENTGRRARCMELDPLYVDVAVRRWQAHTKQHAVRDDGLTFDELSQRGDHANAG